MPQEQNRLKPPPRPPKKPCKSGGVVYLTNVWVMGRKRRKASTTNPAADVFLSLLLELCNSTGSFFCGEAPSFEYLYRLSFAMKC